MKRCRYCNRSIEFKKGKGWWELVEIYEDSSGRRRYATCEFNGAAGHEPNLEVEEVKEIMSKYEV